MKKTIISTILILSIPLLFSNGFCQSMSQEEIINEIRSLKSRISKLENMLTKKDKEIKELKEERKEASEEVKSDRWTDRVDVSAAIEVEYGYEGHDLKDPANNLQPSTTDDSDLVLASFEVGLDAEINRYTQAHVTLKYQEDDNEAFNVDEGTITFGGTDETHGIYLMVGKYCPHFGELNSYFVSSPLTAQVFETGETALQIGVEQDWFSSSLGVFHGNVNEQFETENTINGFFADLNLHNPEDTLNGWSFLLGASYLSNVADSDTLEGQINDINTDTAINDIADYVNGVAAYLVAKYGIFGFGVEYITALDDFRAGEMSYALDRNGVTRSTKPSAWNLELALSPKEDLQFGIKYEGTNDLFGLLPEHQYGAFASWNPFKNTTLSGEYLRGIYDENNQNANGLTEDDRDLFTIQLAVEF